MNILAIETSCDDTGIAILKKNKNVKVLANFYPHKIISTKNTEAYTLALLKENTLKTSFLFF